MGNGMTLFALMVVFTAHWLGDFVWQTDEMALNKSSDNSWLFAHCAVYSMTFIWLGFIFWILNFTIHFCVDYVTSRINARLWAANRRHDFFVMVGLDQLIHIVTLTTLFYYTWVLPLECR